MINKLYLITLLFIIFNRYLPAEPLEEVPDYIIGRGDVLKIIFVNAQYLTKQCTVDSNGNINLPIYTKLNVLNKSLIELKLYLTKMYDEHLKSPEIEVELVKSQKEIQQKINEEFLILLDRLKDSFYKRDFLSALTLCNDISKLVRKANINEVSKNKNEKIDLKIIEHKGVFEGESPYRFYDITGKIKNLVEQPYNWVKVTLNFYDKTERVITTSEKYVINFEPIYQYQVVPFELKGLISPDVTDYDIKISDYSFVDEKKNNSKN